MSRTAGSKNKPKEEKIDARDNKGRFTKGNNNAAFRNPEKQAIKERLHEAITEEEELATLKSLLKSRSDAIKLQALTLVWNYKYGKPKQTVESESTVHLDDKRVVPEEVAKLLAELGS